MTGAVEDRASSPSPAPRPPAALGGRGRRIELLGSVAVIVLVAGTVVVQTVAHWWAPRPTAAQCGALVDRYVVLAARARQRGAADAAPVDQPQRGPVTPARLADEAACRRDLTAHQVSCALAAPAVDDLERCLQ